MTLDTYSFERVSILSISPSSINKGTRTTAPVDNFAGLIPPLASGGIKPAKLSTGAVVRVPLFIEEGEILKIDTRSKEYVSRVK